MTAPNFTYTNFTTGINIINPLDYAATPYFTADATGVYSNGVLIASSTDVDAGSSGVAGTVNIFPATALKGKTTITVSDNSGNTTTNINTAAQTGARTYTVPDAGASASFVMTAGSQTVGGAKTLSSALTINPTTNQLVLGVTNTVTITSPAPAASRVYTLPDAGGAASFALTAGTQTITGANTFSGGVTVATTALTITDVNVVLSAATGTKIGTATSQKLGFYNATPVIQQAGTGVTTAGFVAGAGAAVLVDSTFTGNIGSTAYHISDVVAALKNLGLLAA